MAAMAAAIFVDFFLAFFVDLSAIFLIALQTINTPARGLFNIIFPLYL
jgi:hypothetical protein